MTRIADIQQKNLNLRIKLDNKNKTIERMKKEKEKMLEEFGEYVDSMENAFAMMMTSEKGLIFDRYEFYAATAAWKAKKEIEFEVVENKA